MSWPSLSSNFTESPSEKGKKKFPSKLWCLVNDAGEDSCNWSSTGKTIIINKDKFVKRYLNKKNGLFRTPHFNSFVRQLNLYGFRKVTKQSKRGDEIWCEYKHEKFVRGKEEDVRLIRRKYGHEDGQNEQIDGEDSVEEVKALSVIEQDAIKDGQRQGQEDGDEDNSMAIDLSSKSLRKVKTGGKSKRPRGRKRRALIDVSASPSFNCPQNLSDSSQPVSLSQQASRAQYQPTILSQSFIEPLEPAFSMVQPLSPSTSYSTDCQSSPIALVVNKKDPQERLGHCLVTLDQMFRQQKSTFLKVNDCIKPMNYKLQCLSSFDITLSQLNDENQSHDVADVFPPTYITLDNVPPDALTENPVKEEEANKPFFLEVFLADDESDPDLYENIQ